MIFCVKRSQRLAPEFAQCPDQRRCVEGNHRARAGITSNDGTGLCVIEAEREFGDFLRMSVEIIGEQDFLIGRPKMMDGHVAGRIDFKDFGAPHGEDSLEAALPGANIKPACVWNQAPDIL